MQKRLCKWFQQLLLLLLLLWQPTLTLSIFEYFNSTVTTFAVRFVRKQRINNTNSMADALVFLWAWQGFYEKKNWGTSKCLRSKHVLFFVDLYIGRLSKCQKWNLVWKRTQSFFFFDVFSFKFKYGKTYYYSSLLQHLLFMSKKDLRATA